ncbi:coiled-coil domain-containing protein [Desulfurobacterium thermolithotrophum]|uniref:coiled-coil domain-containing protein n=1 Tax=Desulfurobacterium thermolithotrophum TaxID=64160 RepID=UPI0019530EBC|nr:hypothetical protein [Desulfurobacterium thermolithotrophum]
MLKMMKRVMWVFFSSLLFLSANASGMTPAEEKLLFQTLGEIKGELRQLNRRIDDLDKRMDMVNRRIDDLRKEMNARFEEVDKRFEQVDKRFEQIDKRFEQIDKRFEQVDKRFEQVDKRFEEFFTYIKIMLMGVFGLIGTFVGLLIWDRKTAMNETKRKIYREMNSEVAPEKFVKVIKGLRKLAEKDEVLREYLKKEGLL